MSHPSWVRGLKHNNYIYDVSNLLSHPSWVRGLKQDYRRKTIGRDRSHPSWVRGLKQMQQALNQQQNEVAPLVGAWIETGFNSPDGSRVKRRTPRGCVD